METLQIPEAGSVDYLSMHSIFVFDENSAKRLAIVRMFFGWTQKEIAEHMGCPQQVISDIELGHIRFSPKVTVWALQVALGKPWRFVVWGKGAAQYNEQAIRLRYWREKFKRMGRKKSGGKV